MKQTRARVIFTGGRDFNDQDAVADARVGILRVRRPVVEDGMTWREIEDANRGTGRTQRMLEAAVKAHKEGRAVYIVAAHPEHAIHLRRRVREMLPEEWIHVETATSLGLDWDTMRVPGMHPRCLVFVDHYAIRVRELGWR